MFRLSFAGLFLIILIADSISFLYAVVENPSKRKKVGVPNVKQFFVNRISKKFGLKEVRRVYIPRKITKDNFVNKILNRLSSQQDKDFMLSCYTQQKDKYFLKSRLKTKNRSKVIKLIRSVRYKIYIFREYQNLKKGIIVSFQKDGTRPIKKTLNSIYIFAANKKTLKNIARYFILNTTASKKHKKQWKKYIQKLPFERKPVKYFEYGGVPQLRCLTHEIYNSKRKKTIYYVAMTILD
ncbi:MAG: hypothetical protein IEMM0008_1523 [bacterium]|nr:MAG: hypothetical protein IEMM0008_1523 [bacterium]